MKALERVAAVKAFMGRNFDVRYSFILWFPWIEEELERIFLESFTGIKVADIFDEVVRTSINPLMHQGVNGSMHW